MKTLVISLTLAGSVCAQTEYFVDAALGSDQNPGTCAQPFRSITFALSVATTNDLVEVRPGTYSNTATGETFPLRIGLPRTHTGLLLRGAGVGRTVIDMEQRNASTFVVSRADLARVTGFTITNTGTTDWYAAGFTIGSYQGTNGSTGFRVDHVAFDRTNRGVLLFSTTPPSTQCLVDDCQFTNLANDAMNEFTTGSNWFYNNTVVNTPHLGMTVDSPTATIWNNVFVGCRIGIALAPAATGANIENNDFFANSTSFTGTINGPLNLFVDPQFVSAATGDYRLAAGSPLLELARTGVPVLDADLLRNPRAIDANGDGSPVPDLGCHERTDVALRVLGTWRLGQNVLLDVACPPAVAAVFLFGRQEGALVVPGAGTLLLDPTRLLPFFPALTPAPGQFGLSLPNDPGLSCARIHLQALVVDAQLRMKLTNDLIEWF
jgi:hypothetical protein